MVAVVCATAGLGISGHYPVAPAVALASFAVLTAWFALRPADWLVVLPAALPVLALAPWTGWISFEEIDLLVLGAAAAGHARLAWPAEAAVLDRRPAVPPPRVGWLLALFALSVGASLWRGVADAGGFEPGWFGGYNGSMNSVRLAKPFLWVLLLVAPAHATARAEPRAAAARLTAGVTLGLAGASLAALWELLAFTGLLDFSSDYRTTALFWEMHVGGAAFDGFLVLTVPFAVGALLGSNRFLHWAVRAAVVLLAAYACLTTFSRGVYAAIPVGLTVLAVLSAGQQRRGEGTAPARPPSVHTPAAAALAGVLLAVAFGAAATWLFPLAGYRGTLAAWAAFALLSPVVVAGHQLAPGDRIMGLLGGVVASVATAALPLLLDKGAYVAFATAGAVVLAALAQLHRTRDGRPAALAALAGYVALLAAAVLVARHWGGEAALHRAAPLMAGVLALTLAGLAAAPLTKMPQAGAVWRRQAVLALVMLCGVGALGVFAGGAYMGGRFATGLVDWQGRLQHWRGGLAMLHTPADRLLGRGLGRFPGDLFFAAPLAQRAGDYRFAVDPPGHDGHLVLSAGSHEIDWGELLRVSQRIAPPAAPLHVSARVRAAEDVALHFEVCEKHLLYNAACLLRGVGVKATAGRWQTVDTSLDGASLPSPTWYAPRLVAFSVAVATRGGVVEIDNLRLFDRHGSDLLANGDFSAELARWFFSSDRNHLPWHIKNMFLNLLFDQGVLGLVLACAMLAGAAWRLAAGSARAHPLAPAAAGALAGFVVVGLFDSLLDVPRIAFLFYALVVFGLMVRPPRRVLPAGGAGPSMPAALPSLLAVCGVALALALPDTARAQAGGAGGQPLRVGPSRDIKTVAEAARRARDGDTVEVDAGEYVGDVAIWTQRDVTVRAVGGRARLVAGGADAEGKGTWVIRSGGGRFTVEGFDFIGSKVASGNGAGIRFEAGALSVRDCAFLDNENGILTGNGADLELDVDASEFGRNGRGDGQSHNLYVGSIARLSVSGSYFHRARVGHLLKSRAAVNRVVYNRLTDETGGSASYELEFANGGVAVVIGNLIEQGAQTENPVIVSFGIEGYRHPANELFMAHNTLIDRRAQGGIWVRVAPGAGTVRLVDNLLVGRGDLAAAGSGTFERNATLALADFDRAVTDDYRWLRRPAALPDAVDAGSARGLSLRPAAEYAHPRRVVPLGSARPLVVGALQPAAQPWR